MARLLETFEPAAQQIILNRLPQIQRFWVYANGRKSSALTKSEIHEAIEALPPADPDRQSRRGRQASIDYYRGQLPNHSGRKVGALSPQTQLVCMVCRLYIDAHRIQPSGGRALHDFVYKVLSIIAPKLASPTRITTKAIDRVWDRMRSSR
jgi:hypothetical protein